MQLLRNSGRCKLSKHKLFLFLSCVCTLFSACLYMLWRVLWIFPGISGKKQREKYFLSLSKQKPQWKQFKCLLLSQECPKQLYRQWAWTVLSDLVSKGREEAEVRKQKKASVFHIEDAGIRNQRMLTVKNICCNLSSCRWGSWGTERERGTRTLS